MKEFDFDKILKEFISGDIDMENLSEKIDERLFLLRQKPEMTPEQEHLSNFELLIHEINEGFRSRNELLEYIMSEIESKISEHFVTTITINSSSSSEFQTTARAIPVRDYHLELSLA